MSGDRDDAQRTGPTRPPRPGRTRTALAALSGLIAGFCALAVAELAAAPVRPEAGPVTAVGGAVIDRVPPVVRDFAVRNFGTADKPVLQLGILILLALFAMAIGVLALRHRRMGSAAVLVFGLVGAVAAAGRPEGVPTDVLPSVVGAAVAVAVLYLLVGRLVPAPRTPAGERGKGRTAASTAGASWSRPPPRRRPPPARDSWAGGSPPPSRPEPPPPVMTWSSRHRDPPHRRSRPEPI